jgi:hypothetical protein
MNDSTDSINEIKPTLNSADVNLILDAFENRFYTRMGKSFWEIIKYGTIVIVTGIAGISFYHKG